MARPLAYCVNEAEDAKMGGSYLSLDATVQNQKHLK